MTGAAGAPRVLIVTKSGDNASVRLVAERLVARGAEVVRLDSDRYPGELRIATFLGGGRLQRTLVGGAEHVDLGALTAVWYRRFDAGGRLPAALGDTRPACVHEARRTLLGSIAALGCFELDPWIAVRKADHKELQLKVAQELGLAIPRTLITNEAAALRAFAASVGGPIVTKMQSSFAIYRGGEELVVYTTELGPGDLEDVRGLRYAPMMFQEKVEKRWDIRATVVGREVFSARLDSQTRPVTEVDWRRDGEGLIDAWEPHDLPAEETEALLGLTARFGLNYAAADFVVAKDGRHVFLEINAGGEWFWLQRAPGLPIADAIARVLLGEAERTPSIS